MGSRFPFNWKLVEIGEVAAVGNGSTPSRKEQRYWENGSYPWLPTGKVNERIIWQADEFITQAALDECPIRVFPRGSVLVAMIGQGKTRGMTAYLTIDAAINQNFACIVPKDDLDSWYLFHVLASSYNALRDSSHGSNQGALNCQLISQFLIPLPPLPEQRAIAAILSTWDEAITLTTRLIDALKRRKQILLKMMLVFRQDLPEGWQWAKLGDYVKRRNEWITLDDDTIYRRCTVKLYNLGVFPRDMVHGREIRTKRQQITRKGDLLVAEIDAKVGGFGIVKSDTAGAIVSSHYYLFEIAESLETEFLEQCIYAGILQKQVDAIGSTNYAAIRPEQVGTYKIPLPAQDTQRQIGDFLVLCDREITLYSELAAQLATQKRGLMQQLLTGAVRVQVGD